MGLKIHTRVPTRVPVTLWKVIVQNRMQRENPSSRQRANSNPPFRSWNITIDNRPWRDTNTIDNLVIFGTVPQNGTGSLRNNCTTTPQHNYNIITYRDQTKLESVYKYMEMIHAIENNKLHCALRKQKFFLTKSFCLINQDFSWN